MSSMQIDRLLDTVVKLGASDLHLTVGARPTLRLHGHMVPLNTKVLEQPDMVGLMKSITPERCQQELQEVGGTDFAFTAALHTYLRVTDLRATRVRGLAGAHYRDKVLGVDDTVETAAELPIDRFLDRVYRAAPADLAMLEPTRELDIRATGFYDTVVWNPDAPKSATIADMEAGGYLRFLCVEAALAHAPVVLAAGATWQGTQALHAR